MSEKWTFLILAKEAGGDPHSVRVILEDRDAAKRAAMQVNVDGGQVDVDDEERDYEAPEWKVKQIFESGGVEGADAYIEHVKRHLRDAVRG